LQKALQNSPPAFQSFFQKVIDNPSARVTRNASQKVNGNKIGRYRVTSVANVVYGDEREKQTFQ
jgi:hypothetical protein